MCTHRVPIGSRDELDAEVLRWLRQAYDEACPEALPARVGFARGPVAQR